MSSIQLVYLNSFGSIWEYQEAFLSEKIDWTLVTGPYCPICGESSGYREVTEYYRRVIELWPAREGMVPVARFQCRGETTGRTFSMLPLQLVPYQLYTVETILKALILWREYSKDAEFSGTSYEMEQSLSSESRVTSWLLQKWLLVIQHGFLAVHGELSQRYDFSSVLRATGTAGRLDTVNGYLASVSRGPPVRISAVMTALCIYCQMTGRFMFGVPSQSRGGAR